NDRSQHRKTFNLNGSVAWDIVDNLRLKSELGLDDYRNADNRFYGTTTYYVRNIPSAENQGMPAIIFGNVKRESFRNTNTLSYNLKDVIAEDHNLNLLVGQEYIVTQQEA